MVIGPAGQIATQTGCWQSAPGASFGASFGGQAPVLRAVETRDEQLCSELKNKTLEVVGVPSYSTHWLGPNTTPTCDPWVLMICFEP